MGLLDKVKGILFDEEEVEMPVIKKEPQIKNVMKEEKIEKEENPIKEIKVPKDDFSDKDNYKSESTFTFPIDFEDDDDREPIKPVEEPRPKYEEPKKHRQSEPRNYSDFLNKREEKKKFKPTPIISPVYGVLDQNYKKEDVIVKKDILRTPNELTLDEVRKRAFGSLEDELEENLTTETEASVTKVKEETSKKKETLIETKKEVVEKPIDKKKTIGELIEEDDMDIELPIIESIKEKEFEYNNNDTELEEGPTNSIKDLLDEENNSEIKENKESDEIDEDEADLFSLIDSMYEEKGE